MVNNKTWMGFLALAPFFAIAGLVMYYFVFILNIVSNAEQLENMPDDQAIQTVFTSIGPIILLALAVAALSFIALVFYIIHAVRNPRLQGGSGQIAWIIAIVIASQLAIVVYWIVEILGQKDEPRRGGSAQSTIES